MSNKIHNEVTFKPYNQHQLSFLPPSLDELIDEEHPVRLVNRIIDEIDLSPLIRSYKSGGTSSYHPVMLLKVLLYAYLRNIYSTRKMEEALRENIHFMWLAGNNKPDHNTLARFRNKRLRKHINYIFSQTVHLLVEAGLLSLKEAFIDGTKLEANANKYTFVWGRAIEYNRKRMTSQLEDLVAYTNRVANSEEAVKSVKFKKLDSSKVRETINDINATLQNFDDEDIDPKVKQKLRYAEKNWPDNLDRYDKQEETLDGRNSFSKTDPDATFMRMKDDHMGNGQLKAGYNMQVSTENQFVTNLTVHSSPTDPGTLKEHLESYKDKHGELPKNVTADAGYGSNENYTYLEEEGVDAYVKYPGLHREEKGKLSDFNHDKWEYNEKQNVFICFAGKKLKYLDTIERKTKSGFAQKLDRYRGRGCSKCDFRDECFKGKKKNRVIEVNHKLRTQKKAVKERLYSEEGIRRRKRRCWEVETFFGDLKQNRNFKRFNLRGMTNVLTESLMMAMSYNIRKMPAY